MLKLRSSSPSEQWTAPISWWKRHTLCEITFTTTKPQLLLVGSSTFRYPSPCRTKQTRLTQSFCRVKSSFISEFIMIAGWTCLYRLTKRSAVSRSRPSLVYNGKKLSWMKIIWAKTKKITKKPFSSLLLTGTSWTFSDITTISLPQEFFISALKTRVVRSALT